MKKMLKLEGKRPKRRLWLKAVIFTVVILVVAAGVFLLLKEGEKLQSKSPAQIYKNSRESLFYINTVCSGQIYYPYFNFTWYYDPSEDTVHFTPAPTDDWAAWHNPESEFATAILFGTGFGVNGKTYTSAHVINCSPKGFANLYYDALDSSLSYIASLPKENISDAINFTEKITDYPISYFSEYILGEVVNTYGNTTLTKGDIALTIMNLLTEHARDTLTVYNVSLVKVVGIKSTATLEDYESAEVLETGKPWPGNDYAILSLNESKPKGLMFGDSDKVKVGDMVYVLGYPVGAVISENSLLEPTLTQGIVSSRKELENGYMYIQIDAASSKGNSGGPVFNQQGQVIGILTYVSGESFTFVFPSNSIPRN